MVEGEIQFDQNEMQFVHIKDNSVIYCLLDDLEFLETHRVFVDGTFRPAAYLPNYYQLVNFAIKKESADKQRSFVYPIVSVLLKNKSQATYTAAIRDIKDLFFEKFNRELVISDVNCDQVSKIENAQFGAPNGAFSTV